jgi:ribosomal-protein-serine acetyltransferase
MRPRRARSSLHRVLTFPLSDDCWLRFLEESDADALYAAIDANRAYLARWLPWAQDETPELALEFIRLTRRQLAANDGFQTAIVHQGDIIGMVGFHGVRWQHGTTGMGYWLAEDHQGRGTMTRAVSALTDHAFSTWKLNRVEIQAAVDNARSRAIPERLGFREEGVRRAAERVGERYHDVVVYSMLAEEWTTR